MIPAFVPKFLNGAFVDIALKNFKQKINLFPIKPLLASLPLLGHHISMDAPQEIKSRLDVADVVGEYLQLKPAGAGSFKGLCPFHQENTPSFYVNRGRQSFHCFGCDKGGDILTFVQEMEGIGFREALEHLAQKAGVTLPAPSAADAQKSSERKRLQEVNELAAKFFRATLLQSPEAEHARAYAAKRGIDDLTGDLFKIGYAPSGWDGLTKALFAKGVTADELLKAGLAIKNDQRGSVYDRFRDRLMFTIQDIHGNVVGFTGRLLSEDKEQAKYVNTPETPLYKKSGVLYGLDKAKSDIKRQNLAVMVEGNMDVLTSHRLGVTNVVCSSGTALTDEQLRLIERFTKNIAIAFDADKAGMAATLRGLDLARARDFTIKLITLPPEAGKDPDEAATKDIALWKNAIRDASDVMDWIFRMAFKNRDISQPEIKKQIAANVLPEIKRIADPIVRDHWLKKLAGGLGADPSALAESLRRHADVSIPTPRADAPRGAGSTPAPKPYAGRFAGPTPMRPEAPIRKERDEEIGERILCVLLTDPALFSEIPPGVTESLPSRLQPLYSLLKERYDHPRSNEAAVAPQPIGAQENDSQARLVDYLTILADKELPDRAGKTLKATLLHACTLLKQFHTTRARKQLESEMRAAELAGDAARIAVLAEQFKTLT
ncbi:MAG: hypothetical protein RL141_859 [Candidatus Parcubacteria bacterium]|jgi:DNA primase